MDPEPTTADSLFVACFLPLYPPEARRDLAAARARDANPGKNPGVLAHLDDAAARFQALYPTLAGEDPGLDLTDASVHRLSKTLTRARRDAWLAGAGTPECALFNVVVHGAAYVGACVVARHGGAWTARSPLWESRVRLASRMGEGELPVFHWWLKSLADAALDGGATLADRYRAHVEVPCARPEDLPPLFAGERRLPRLGKVRYDTLNKYLKAHLPELRDLGEAFPSPERLDELGLKWLDMLALGGNRVLLMAGPGRSGLHLFFLTAGGFEKALFYAADPFPDPIVRPRGDRLEVLFATGGTETAHEMPYWGL